MRSQLRKVARASPEDQDLENGSSVHSRASLLSQKVTKSIDNIVYIIYAKRYKVKPNRLSQLIAFQHFDDAASTHLRRTPLGSGENCTV